MLRLNIRKTVLCTWIITTNMSQKEKLLNKSCVHTGEGFTFNSAEDLDGLRHQAPPSRVRRCRSSVLL